MAAIPFIVTTDLLASKKQRVMDFLLDFLFITLINGSIFATLSIIADMTTNYGLQGWLESHRYIMPRTWFFVAFIYFMLTEMIFSRTPAKFFTKTIVVMKDGTRLNSKAVIRRTLWRFVPFEQLTFFGKESRGWHDLFSDTYVVKKHRFNRKQGHEPFYG